MFLNSFTISNVTVSMYGTKIPTAVVTVAEDGGKCRILESKPFPSRAAMRKWCNRKAATMRFGEFKS